MKLIYCQKITPSLKQCIVGGQKSISEYTVQTFDHETTLYGERRVTGFTPGV
jgi:hypothetical protein